MCCGSSEAISVMVSSVVWRSVGFDWCGISQTNSFLCDIESREICRLSIPYYRNLQSDAADISWVQSGEVMPVVCGGGLACFLSVRSYVRVAEVGWLGNLGELRRVRG